MSPQDTTISKDSKVAIWIAVIALLGNLYIEMTHDDKANAVKIATLEAHQKQEETSMEKVDHAIERVNDKVDKLVEWALGAKPQQR